MSAVPPPSGSGSPWRSRRRRASPTNRNLGRVGRAVGVEHDDDVAGRRGEAASSAAPLPLPGWYTIGRPAHSSVRRPRCRRTNAPSTRMTCRSRPGTRQHIGEVSASFIAGITTLTVGVSMSCARDDERIGSRTATMRANAGADRADHAPAASVAEPRGAHFASGVADRLNGSTGEKPCNAQRGARGRPSS